MNPLNIVRAYNLDLDNHLDLADYTCLVIEEVDTELDKLKQQWLQHDQSNLDIKLWVLNQVKTAVLNMQPGIHCD